MSPGLVFSEEKNDAGSQPQIVLHACGRVGKLRAQPIGLERTYCKVALPVEIHAAAQLHCQAVGELKVAMGLRTEPSAVPYVMGAGFAQ
jgi:hypothetical protein